VPSSNHSPTPGVAPLQLPGGRIAQVIGNERDLTLIEPLRSSGDSWEPHVGAIFERLVPPDWVCLDIGANIGAHTLALASLATRGQVIAFEASRHSFGYLRENAAALAEPKALITLVHSALWDTPGRITWPRARSCRWRLRLRAEPGLSDSEQTHVVAGREVPHTIRIEDVAAVRLDEWIDDHPVPRLDLIKLDVEGAESRVLAGAKATLNRFSSGARDRVQRQLRDGLFRGRSRQLLLTTRDLVRFQSTDRTRRWPFQASRLGESCRQAERGQRLGRSARGL
jgi:FkbM family methyltransferase